MGILDDALNSQDAKRSQRLNREAQKSKVDSNKIKEGTYRGIDLVDGTAKIQLDGQTNATSGYKLITNAPLGDGDRVSIRPNGIGMPRGDAKNVAPAKGKEQKEIILREAYLTGIDINLFSGSSLGGQSKSDFRFYGIGGSNGSLITYSYENTELVKASKSANLTIGAFVEPPDGNITASLCSLIATSNKDNFTVDVTLNTPFISLPPIAPNAIILNYEIRFLGKQWKDIFNKFNIDFASLPNKRASFPWHDSPIEIEALGGVTGGALASFGDNVGTMINIREYLGDYLLAVDPVTPYIQSFPTGSAQYSFSFRYRKRGKLKWFSF